MQQWYYSQNGSQMGPVSQEELKSMLAYGSVRSSELVWTEGMSGWAAASTIPELQSQPQTPAGAPPLPVANPFANPYAAPRAQVSYPQGQPAPNYLWQSIVVTLLCCLPLGIPAIVYASKVDSLNAAGDFAGAKSASDTAKMWCWISFGLGVGFGVLWFVAAAISGAAGSGM